MGLLDSVKNLLGRWSGKRKRPDDDEESTNSKKSRVSTYTITPAKSNTSEVKEIRTHKSCYTYNEEIKSTETRTVEFKQGGVLFKNDAFIQLIQKYGPAFLNCEGGVLLAGVTDWGIVKGVTVSESDKQRFSFLANKEIEGFRPTVSRDLWSVSYVPVVETSRFRRNDLMVVEISFGKGKAGEIYENSLHTVYLRRDGGVQGPLRPLDIRNLVIARYNETLKCRKNQENQKAKSLTPIAEEVTCDSITKERSLTNEKQTRKEKLEKLGIKYIVID